MIHVSCDSCGADNAALLFRAADTNYGFAGLFDLVRCRQCGLVYLNPRPDEQEINAYYPDGEYTCFKNLAAPLPLGSGHHFVVTSAALGMTPGRLCDVGCGAGDFLAAAHASGWQVTGIEPSEHAQGLVAARLPTAALYTTLDAAAFPAASFDAVTMWHVFEHLPSPAATLREIQRILRPGGLVGIAVPNFGSVERRIWGPRWIAIQAPTHFYHFERATLLRYLQDNGFQVLSMTQAIGANSLAANVLRTLRNLILDPWAARKRSSKPEAAVASRPANGPDRHATGYTLSAPAKQTALRIMTRLFYPLAWLIARMGYGPELLVYAQKPVREEHSQ